MSGDESVLDYLSTIPVPEKSRENVLKPRLDSQNTTIGSVQRLLVQDKFTSNLDLSGLHQGVVMKVIENPRTFEYSPKNELETFNQNKSNNNAVKYPLRYKVYVQGPAGACHPIPENINSVAIDFLDDYSLSPSLSLRLTPMAIVFVDIVDKTINAVNDPTAYTQINGSNGNPSAAYNGSSKEPTTVGSRTPDSRMDIAPTPPSSREEALPDNAEKKFTSPLIGNFRITSLARERLDPLGSEKIKKHGGVDIAAPVGTRIFAIADGLITSVREVEAEKGKGCGINVILKIKDNNNFYQITHCHMSAVAVKANQKVNKGDVLGLVGNTGGSTGPHLHFQVFDFSVRKVVNPYSVKKIADCLPKEEIGIAEFKPSFSDE